MGDPIRVGAGVSFLCCRLAVLPSLWYGRERLGFEGGATVREEGLWAVFTAQALHGAFPFAAVAEARTNEAAMNRTMSN